MQKDFDRMIDKKKLKFKMLYTGYTANSVWIKIVAHTTLHQT